MADQDSHRAGGGGSVSDEPAITPAQRLYAATFGLSRTANPPRLDAQRVRKMVEGLPDRREARAVALFFGFSGKPLIMARVGRRLPRADGGKGVSREIARRLVARALARLRHPARRAAWREAMVR